MVDLLITFLRQHEMVGSLEVAECGFIEALQPSHTDQISKFRHYTNLIRGSLCAV